MERIILIIDDDKELCALMKKCAEQEGLDADTVYTGRAGLSQITGQNRDYCLVILDVMLPGMDGFEVLSEIRKSSTVPVLMLTAKGDEIDKIKGLRLGADDYLTKPFSINELMARVNSLIRRYTTLNPMTEIDMERIVLKGMVIDKANRIVSVNDNPVELTSKEFDLLSFLSSNKGRVFTKNRFIRKCGKKNMLLTIVTLCLSSANCGKRSNQTPTIHFIF